VRSKLRQRVEATAAAGGTVRPEEVPALLRALTDDYGWSPAA
jgi:hypothetical protein